MTGRRILSLWFPHLLADYALRHQIDADQIAFAVVNNSQNLVGLYAVNSVAAAQGLQAGQSLSDARALCPNLMTIPYDPLAEKSVLTALNRWAGKYTPWVATEGVDGFSLDITGCSHLFGGESQMMDTVTHDCQDLGFELRLGLADTAGAAWALARYAGQAHLNHRSGDDINQEARATRSRSAKRRNWERGGSVMLKGACIAATDRIAPPGGVRDALGGLPPAALRISDEAARGMARLGISQISQIWSLPRKALARRFGTEVMQRLDQAMGFVPEPISPKGQPLHFATRMSFPDPIGLEADILAAIDRLLPPLCEKLGRYGRGLRKVQMISTRTDGTTQVIEAGLAQATLDVDRIRPLLALQLPRVDAGFGIDMIRMAALVSEPFSAVQHKGPMSATEAAKLRRDNKGALGYADLIGRLGARIGLDAITYLHPAESHIPEKQSKHVMVAYSKPVSEWPQDHRPRPYLMFSPEALHIPDGVEISQDARDLPLEFSWRRKKYQVARAIGPERIAPEWWLDDPNWRSGPRDYWRVVTQSGDRLWLFRTHNDAIASWFCQGVFS